jgi:hypothetical protein
VVFVIADDLIALAFPKYVGAGDAVRILCAVAVLRSVSFVVPPLLDGVGHPTRTLMYTITAALTLPLAFLSGAYFFGGELGFLSVAWAWAIGYPIAFIVLVMLAIYTLDMRTADFLRSVSGVAVCMVIGCVLGEVVHYFGAALPIAVRLVVTTAAIVLTIGLLLAYTQGLSIRGAMKSLKGDPPPAP